MTQPYYSRGGVDLYLGDCREVLPTLGRVDAIITDPPYGTLDGRGKVHKQGSSLVPFNVGAWDRLLPLDWIAPALSILADGCWVSAFTDKLSVKALWDAFEQNGGRGKQTFYWIKTNPPPQPRHNFASGVETAVAATKGAVSKWNGGGWTLNWFQAPIVGGRERVGHPTQKPVRLMSQLVSVLSHPGDLVLDPFAGSGSTLVAAVQAGRRAIGVELDEHYCDLIAKRLDALTLPLEVVA